MSRLQITTFNVSHNFHSVYDSIKCFSNLTLNLFFILILFSVNIQAQIISSEESGFLSFGQIFTVSAGATDTIRYAINGLKPTENSPYFVGQKEFTFNPPNELEPIFAKINTMVRDPERTLPWHGNHYAQPDSIFEKIDSVGKIGVYWFSIKSCQLESDCEKLLQFVDPTQHEERHGTIPAVFMFGDPKDFYGDYGIFVDGECARFEYWDTFPDPMEITWTNQNFQSLNYDGEIISIYSVIADEETILDSIFIDITASAATVYLGNELIYTYGVQVSYFDADSISFTMEGILRNIAASTFWYNGGLCPPMFYVRDDIFELYPELDDSIIKKEINVLVLQNGEVIHNNEGTVKTTGQTSAFFPDKSVTIKFPKDKRLESQVLANGPESFSHVYLRNIGSGKNVNDLIINTILKDDQIGAQQGRNCVFYVNGEFNGMRWFREKLNASFIETHYGFDDDEVIIFTWYGEAGLLEPKSCTQDESVQYQEWLSPLVQELSSFNVIPNHIIPVIKESIDTESFFKARFIQGFFDDSDGSNSNTRLFMDKTEQIVYEMIKDYDLSMDIWNSTYAFEQLFQESPRVASRGWHLNKYLTNQKLKNEYLNIAYDLLSTSLRTEIMHPIAEWANIGLLEQAKQHFDRWGHVPTEGFWNIAIDHFNYEDTSYYDFLSNRPQFVSGYLKEYFEFFDTTSVYFKVQNIGNCENKISISSVKNEATSDWTWRHTPVGIPAPITVNKDQFLFFIVNEDTIMQLDTLTAFKDSIYYITAVFDCSIINNSTQNTNPNNNIYPNPTSKQLFIGKD
jgi:hypothetical protein